MYTTTIQQQTPATTILPTFAFPELKRPAPVGKRQLTKGQTIFDKDTLCNPTYLVHSGEVVIVCNGLLIDLVETGELLEAALWPDAIAIALTDCTLESLEIPISRVQPC